MTNNQILNGQETTEDVIDVKEFLMSILRNWYWILLCVAIAFFAARFYLRYSVPIYRANGQILIKEDPTSGGTLSEEAVLQEIGLINSGNKLVNEIQILKSRSMMQMVMDRLGLDVQYIGLGRIKDSDLYGNSPVIVDSIHWGGERRTARLEIQTQGDGSYQLILEQNGENSSVHRFGEPLIRGRDTFWLSEQYPVDRDMQLEVKIGQAPGKYLQNLKINVVGTYSNVLSLEMEDPVPQKAADILNVLIEEYNRAAIDDKNQVAKKTLDFIEERIRLLTNELGTVEGSLERYKESNDIPGQATTAIDYILNGIRGYDSQLTQDQIQLELMKSVEELLTSDVERYELIPSNLTLTDVAGLGQQIAAYNQLVLDRERLQRSAGSSNSQLRSLEEQLGRLRQNVVESVRSFQQNMQLSIQETRRKLNQLEARINQVPRQERELLEIERQQNIKEALYLYLLQKKEETSLSAAITVPNARVIDPAITGKAPISPRPIQIYTIFLLLGFTLPVGIVLLRETLDNKIYSEADITKLTQTPMLGTLVQNRSNSPVVVKAGSRTAIAEMFRLLRTNLTYLSGGKEKQTILITSGMGGDGKTFIAANLGISLALAGKKVVLLGMDLRKPKLVRYLSGLSDSGQKGLTNYLVGDMSNSEILNVSDINENLYFIPSGPIPPNPAELLSTDKLGDLFDWLKETFDYVLIDTAPLGLVADALLLESFTDVTLFAVRYGKTPQDVIRMLEQMRRDRKLINPAIVLNGVKKGKGYGYGYGYQYGYGYGYGYYEEEKKQRRWFKKREKSTD